jgi:5-methylcytosine-specific restriction endonuclease McrA
MTNLKLTKRLCITCLQPFEPTASNTSRCAQHQRRKVNRDRSYRDLATSITTTATCCGICGKPFEPGDRRVVDHIRPLAHGGSDDPSNLQAAHRRCNGLKSSKLPRGLYP